MNLKLLRREKDIFERYRPVKHEVEWKSFFSPLMALVPPWQSEQSRQRPGLPALLLVSIGGHVLFWSAALVLPTPHAIAFSILGWHTPRAFILSRDCPTSPWQSWEWASACVEDETSASSCAEDVKNEIVCVKNGQGVWVDGVRELTLLSCTVSVSFLPLMGNLVSTARPYLS